ncbi:MAG TPA: TetR family transcriptional regulator, partial [Kofleriaceae bacterium]|nr:TetR family transcriptional regulator [Kofleriaceae bacterium]
MSSAPRRRTRRPRDVASVPAPRVPAVRPGPRGGVRDANRRARLETLADAALSLFLEGGVAGVPIDRIVERAGVAKG